jgi:hypothetical protein
MRRFLVPTGAIDGVNKDFTLPNGFSMVPGSLFIVVGGLTIPASHDNGAIETSTTTFQTKDTLQVGDALLAIIDDGVSGTGGTEISLTVDPVDYNLTFNANNYKISFNTNNYKLDMNAYNYKIPFNTNTIKLS